MNNKILFLLFTLIVTIFIFSLVHAEDIEIVVPEKTVTVYAGEVNEIEILIKNNRDVKDTFYFSTWPSYWVTLKKYWMSLNASEVTSIKMIIEPPRDAEEGTYIFTITVMSVDYNVSASEEIYFYVKRLTNVYISDIGLNKQTFKPDETLIIQPVLTNIDKKQRMNVFVTTKILKDDSIIQRFEDNPSIEPKSSIQLSHNFDVKINHVPGDYEITVTVRNALNKILDEKSTTFKIETVHEVGEEKEVKNSLLYSTVIIKITNNGNVPESDFYVSESLPLISKNFFYPEKEPTSEEEKENRIVYKWLVTDLNPGETITIEYQLRFVNVVLVSCILIIIIIWVVWLFYRPKLMKRYMGLVAKEKEITISLYLKNKRRKFLNDVIVRDFVPAFASVIKKFDTLTPNIKRKAMGTELVWNIKQLKPKEERILTYKIKPVIEIVGKLKLPKAYFIYKTKKGKRRKILSKTITLMGKVK